MKLQCLINEEYNVISIKGILRNLTNDEKKIYSKIRKQEDGKLFKKKISPFYLRVANDMVSKGLISRRKNPQGEIYFVCKGRRKTL